MNDTFVREKPHCEVSSDDEENVLNYTLPEVSVIVQTGRDEKNIAQDPSSDVIMSHFFKELTAAFQTAEEKIKAQANSTYSDLALNMSTALQQEQHRHAKEKDELCQQVSDLHLCVRSLESLLNSRRGSMETLLNKLQQHSNLVLCSKIFYSWKLYAQNRKRERFKESMAVKHYEKTLKQKAFSWWFTQLNVGWKHRMELKANMEIVKMQKQIVNLYEGKIKNLEDNLCAADRTITSLQSRHKVIANAINRPNILDYAPANVNDPSAREEQYRSITGSHEEAAARGDIVISLCSACSTQQAKSHSPGSSRLTLNNFDEPEPRKVKPPPLFIQSYRPISPPFTHSCHSLPAPEEVQAQRSVPYKDHHRLTDSIPSHSHSCHVLSKTNASSSSYTTKELLIQQQPSHIDGKRSRPSSGKFSKQKKTV